MKILCDDSNEKAWLDARGSLLTASDAATWLGMNDWRTRAELEAEKRSGLRQKITGSGESSVVHGRVSEGHNMAKASKMLGLPTVPYHYLIQHDHKWPHLGATLDGLGLLDFMVPPNVSYAKYGHKSFSTQGRVLETIAELQSLSGVIIVEAKSTDSHIWKKKDKPRQWIDEAPECYVLQCQVQMYLSGVPQAVLVAQLGAGNMTAYTVFKDDRFEATLDQLNAEFGELMKEAGRLPLSSSIGF